MKIGLPSNGEQLSDTLASTFGRCPYLIIYDSDSQKIVNSFFNESQNAAGGAGIQTAQSLVNNHVEVVIAPQIGPNAWNVIKQAGIKTYIGFHGTIQGNIDKFLKGQLTEMTMASGSGYGGGHGRGRGMGQGRRRKNK
ncbi:MAG: NifB/NifX family molybdenum-iron cluster-binding protein [Candidatus Hodarchaeales archaeon]